MVLFSRAFIRKRLISLATTASVAATSFAFAEDPARTDEMMVPHHQGAVDVAKAELKYGHNEQLRRLAQEIVANQQQQIKVMRNAVSDGPSSAAQSPQSSPAGPAGGMKMPQ